MYSSRRMVKKSKSEANLPTKAFINVTKVEKKRDKEYFKENFAKMNSLVKSLEYSLYESQRNEMHLKKQQAAKETLKTQIDEAKKENKQLLNVLQQQCSKHDLSTSRSQIDVSPSYSTVSMVHLQYKYEELLSSHEGLLKLLESKVKEVRKCYKENEKLQMELKNNRTYFDEYQKSINMICEKYMKLKQRKEKKIKKIKFERDTIKIAHDKLVYLLHQKCMEHDENLLQYLGRTPDCIKALLINEIRRANKLQYENAILNQRNSYLNAKFGKNNSSIKEVKS